MSRVQNKVNNSVPKGKVGCRDGAQGDSRIQ